MTDDRPTFGSLFAGIGGIDLGLERAGWECRFQVEWDPFCQRVLAKHWPDVPRFGDIADVDWSGVPPVDLLAGGFPCQPFSVAGKQRRLDDDRWLWPEFARAIRELRPRYVLVENVPGLLVGGGMDAVLGDLAELGYDAEWESIPAAAVGAPHLRYRVWIIAYRAELGGNVADPDDGRPLHAVRAGRDAIGYGGADELAGRFVPGRECDACGEPWCDRHNGHYADCACVGWSQLLADPEGAGLQGRQDGGGLRSELAGPWQGGGPVAHQWSIEPDVGRVAHGVPARVDRLRSLGNAVVPQVVEVIGRQLMEREGS
jgi:DNA (cytosine-5)-methyltransferase 1